MIRQHFIPMNNIKVTTSPSTIWERPGKSVLAQLEGGQPPPAMGPLKHQ